MSLSFAAAMAFNFAHTVGTGYYYSSFHYLGYSPYSAAGGISAHDGDVKPDIACQWVSRFLWMFSCVAAILLGEPAGALRGRAEVPRAGDEDRGAGNKGAFSQWRIYWSSDWQNLMRI